MSACLSAGGVHSLFGQCPKRRIGFWNGASLTIGEFLPFVPTSPKKSIFHKWWNCVLLQNTLVAFNVLEVDWIRIRDGHADAGICIMRFMRIMRIYVGICRCGWRTHPHEPNINTCQQWSFFGPNFNKKKRSKFVAGDNFFLNAHNFGTESPTTIRHILNWPQEQGLSSCPLMRLICNNMHPMRIDAHLQI